MVVGMPTVGVRIFGCGLGLVVDGVGISLVGGRLFGVVEKYVGSGNLKNIKNVVWF